MREDCKSFDTFMGVRRVMLERYPEWQQAFDSDPELAEIRDSFDRFMSGPWSEPAPTSQPATSAPRVDF